MIKLASLHMPAGGHLRRGGLTIASLFSGVGGFELALEKGGHKAHLLCELDPVAKSVLKQRFPGTQLISDVSELASLPSQTDLVCAGFPCQNLSMAGDKRGIAGPKSSLVDHVFRLLDAQQVSWVLFENVYFMLHLDGGKAMEQHHWKLGTKENEVGLPGIEYPRVWLAPAPAPCVSDRQPRPRSARRDSFG